MLSILLFLYLLWHKSSVLVGVAFGAGELTEQLSAAAGSTCLAALARLGTRPLVAEPAGHKLITAHQADDRHWRMKVYNTTEQK